MSRFVQKLKPWLLPVALLLVMGTIPFLKFLTTDQMFYGSDQIGGYFNYVKMAEMLRHFTVYGWHPWYLSGMPTLDSIFGDILYPGFWVVILLAETHRALGLLFWLHTLLAGFGAVVLFRRSFRLDRWSATAVAAAYMLNLNFISTMHSGHTAKIYIMAWLPLALHCLIRLLSKESRWWHPLGLSIILGMMVLTSHLQTVYYVLIGFFFYLLWRLWEMWKEKEGLAAMSRKFLAFWVAILLGIGLAMPVFYPPMQYTKAFSVRNTAEKTTYEHATSWSINWEETASLVVPEFCGINENYWGHNPFKLNSEYAGIAITAMGIAAAVVLKSRWSWFWIGIAVLAVLNALGANTPFYRLLYGFDLGNGHHISVPGIRNFRAPSMIMFWWAMALCVLSALWLKAVDGVDSWDSKRREKARKGLLIAAGVTAGILVVLAAMPDMTFSLWNSTFGEGGAKAEQLWAQNTGAFQMGAIRAAILAGGILLVSSLWVDGKVKKPFVLGVFFLAVAIDLFPLAGKFIETFSYNEYYAEDPTLASLRADHGTWRAMDLPGAVNSGALMLYNYQTAGGFADNELSYEREFRSDDYKRVLTGLRQYPDGTIEGSRTLDLLNVKYLIYRAGKDQSAPLGVAPNRSVLPHIRLVGSASETPLDQQLAKILDPSFPYRTQVLLDPSETAKDPVAKSLVGASARTPAPSKVVWENADPDHWTITTESPRPALVALSEIWYPHWHATLDGKPVEILRADYALRAIAVPAGKHEIRMTYSSPWVVLGCKVAAVSAVALLLWGLLGFLWGRRRRAA